MVKRAFQIVKKLITEALVLQLPNFEQPFKVAFDASHVGIRGVVLSQQRHPIMFFSETVNET